MKTLVAHAGVRGIPANYGGSEQAIETLTPVLKARGWDTLVYCRPGHYDVRPAEWRGARLVYLPAPRSKNLETIVHSLLATLHAGFVARPTVLHYHGRGNAIFLPLARLFGLRPLLWVDGLEWERAKWGWFARLYHKWVADPIAALLRRWVVADAPTVAAYYRRRYGIAVPWVGFGATDASHERDPTLLDELGLRGPYCLFVGRLTPEKEVHTLLAAYRTVRTDWPLVVVGDNPYDRDYIAHLQELADARVRFVGPRFGSAYRALLAGASISIHPSRVEGMSPALLTALASGRPTVVSDIPENVEAAGDVAEYFTAGDAASLAGALQRLIDDSDLRAARGARARAMARSRYSWEVVADQLVELYGGRPPSG